MKIIITHAFSGALKEMTEQMGEKLKRQYQDADVLLWEAAKPATREELRQAEADLLVSFNLRGFEYGTLAGGIAYNLLDCKQVHFLLADGLPNENCLEKQLSIAMFFFCADSRYCKYLAEKYPEMPYLEEIEGWRQQDTAEDIENNAALLCGIVEKVILLCHMGG